MNKCLRKIKLNTFLLFCLGVFSTMPIVCFNILGRYISFFTVFLVISIVYLMFNAVFSKENLTGNKNVLLLIVWFCMAIFSSLCGWLYFRSNPVWQAASVSYISKLVVYIVFIILWISQRKKPENTSALLEGLIIGCVLNLIWAVLDGICFYGLGFSLHNRVFASYAQHYDIRNGSLSIITVGMIRSAGFNYDPAHMGFIVPVVIAYSIRKKSMPLFLLALGGIVCSASTTALVCTVLSIIINYKYISLRITNKNAIWYAFFIFAVIFILLSALMGRNSLIGSIVNKFFNRITNTYVNVSENNERYIYLTKFFSAVLTAGPMIILGTGFGTASYAYVFNEDILSQLGAVNFFPYDMEMTYISYLFDLGIFGIIVYLIIIFRLVRGAKGNTADDKVKYSMLIGIILSALFYHYTLMSMQVLLIIAGTAALNDKESIKNYSVKLNERGIGEKT